MATSDTPILVAYQAMSDARAAASKPTAPKPKPAHVLAKEASGHSYIKGDRAMAVMLTPQERKLNRKIRKARTERPLTQSGVPNDLTGSPEVGERLVAGRALESKDLSTVAVRHDAEYVKAVQEVARRKNRGHRVGERKLYPPRPEHEYK